MRNMYMLLKENETPKINNARLNAVKRAAQLPNGIIIEKHTGSTITYTHDIADLDEAAKVIKAWREEEWKSNPGICMHAMFD